MNKTLGLQIFVALLEVLYISTFSTGAAIPRNASTVLPPFLTLEEHFATTELLPAVAANPFILRQAEQLLSFSDLRLRDMNNGNIVKQIISAIPVVANITQCQNANNALFAGVKKNPSRFGGWTMLPMSDPPAAVEELTRGVKELGFVGALINNHDQGRFYDNETYWPIFARAENLDVPIYLHPSSPAPAWTERFVGNYPATVSLSLGLGTWDWHEEVGLHILRLFNSGFFDTFPHIKLILGHMGEMLPYLLDRIIDFGERQKDWPARSRDIRTVWTENLWITTSGMFSLRPFACLVRQMPVERILYSVDWPFSNNTQGLAFMQELRSSGLVTEKELEGIAYKNAQSLLKVQL